MKFATVTYDPYDNSIFDAIVFADKASAKSYARHWRCPGNYGCYIVELHGNYPLNVVIDHGLYWKRFQAEMEANIREETR